MQAPNRFQRKDCSAPTVISQLNFNNLIIGNYYKLSVWCNISARTITAYNGGVAVLQYKFTGSGSSGFWGRSSIFRATGTTITYTGALYSTNSGAHAVLEELNNYSETKSFSAKNPLLNHYNLWTRLFNEVSTTGLGQLSRTGSSINWNNIAYDTLALTGDFYFSGSFSTTIATTGVLIGYKKTTLPTVASSNPATNVSSAIYIVNFLPTSDCQGFNGTDGTAVLNAPVLINTGAHTFAIRRFGGVITASVDNIEILTDTYAGVLYLCATYEQNNGGSITAATVT